MASNPLLLPELAKRTEALRCAVREALANNVSKRVAWELGKASNDAKLAEEASTAAAETTAAAAALMAALIAAAAALV